VDVYGPPISNLLAHFKFDNTRVRFGSCNYRTRTISVSRHLTELNTWEDVANTVFHEIAHGLAGKRAGHGRPWKLHADSIGCTAERCYDANAVIAVPKKFFGTCLNCKRRSGSIAETVLPL
jgi:predicted SprT family Zn-dependent metalloprotease